MKAPDTLGSSVEDILAALENPDNVMLVLAIFAQETLEKKPTAAEVDGFARALVSDALEADGITVTPDTIDDTLARLHRRSSPEVLPSAFFLDLAVRGLRLHLAKAVEMNAS